MTAMKQLPLVLHYLDVRARAEPIRMIFHYGGVHFEDHIIKRSEWNNGMKYNRAIAPFTQVPSLTLPNGETIAQTGAVIRIAAKLAGIYPSDVFEAGRADMVFEKAVDMGLINPIVNIFPVDSEQWKSNHDNYFRVLPGHLSDLTTLLGDKQFFGGDNPHYGDFTIFHILSQCLTIQPNALDEYPTLLRFTDRVKLIPAIEKYLATRPRAKENGMPGSFIQTRVVD